jgi:hypothetical protein
MEMQLDKFGFKWFIVQIKFMVPKYLFPVCVTKYTKHVKHL